jgi:radical SAM superfamily enzyme YgiQ (UPF0313 family)
MIILGSWKQQPITISNKYNSFTISIEKNKTTSVYSFDKNGRLWTAMINGISYRRGLNGKIVAKWSSGREVLNRRWLSAKEAEKLLNDAHGLLNELHQDLISGRVKTEQQISDNVFKEIRIISAITSAFYKLETENYHTIYKPVGILPPDQYFSVVLQLTEGCSFNTCTFCDFYKDRLFRIKDPEQFENHIDGVINLIGSGINLRRTIFLGDANALVVPMRKLVPLFNIINKKLKVLELGGIFAFLDGFSGEKKNMEDFRLLKSLGLEKVYIGMESGHDPLLKFLHKPGTSRELLKAVKAIKSGGVSVGIIILLGAGGKQYSDKHISDTIKVINQMNLDADDILYFSELIENEGLSYSQNAFQNNLEALSAEERLLQKHLIEKKLQFAANDSPHISQYDIRDFVY